MRDQRTRNKIHGVCPAIKADKILIEYSKGLQVNYDTVTNYEKAKKRLEKQGFTVRIVNTPQTHKNP